MAILQEQQLILCTSDRLSLTPKGLDKVRDASSLSLLLPLTTMHVLKCC